MAFIDRRYRLPLFLAILTGPVATLAVVALAVRLHNQKHGPTGDIVLSVASALVQSKIHLWYIFGAVTAVIFLILGLKQGRNTKL